MSEKKVLLLDCDGVLSNFITPATKIINEVAGTNFKPEDFKTWDIFAELTDEQERECYSRFHKKDWCYDLEPYPEALAALPVLADYADIYIVTSPMGSSAHWMYERRAWIYKHFKIPEKRLIQTSAKHLVRGDVFVDDRPDNVRAWQQSWPNAKGLLWDMTYNRGPECADLQRVENWVAVKRILLGP